MSSDASAAAGEAEIDRDSDAETTGIQPDTKDWTWVLQRACPECGFDPAALTGAEVPARLRAAAERWGSVLARPGVGTRPSPYVWSPLEYMCHVRDVCVVFGGRLRLLLTQEDPLFENWDQDQTAETSRYAEQDPAMVADQLGDAALSAAAAFAEVREDQWERPGRRSNGSAFTVESLGRYFVHDVEHHLYDVESALRRAEEHLPEGTSSGGRGDPRLPAS